MNRPTRQTGFTLLELMTALTLFSLVVTLGYQSMTRLMTNKRSIEHHSSKQTSKRLAHQTLRSAFDAGAQLNGNSQRLTLNLNQSDSLYFPTSSEQSFVLDNGSLLNQTHQNSNPIELMSNLDLAKFTYIDSGNRHTVWAHNYAPQIIELTWRHQGQWHQWLFSPR